MMLPAHERVDRERHFVRMTRAPGNDSLKFHGIIRNGADFHELFFDNLDVSHLTTSIPRSVAFLGVSEVLEPIYFVL
jgi:hypothetical protein